MKTQLTVVAGVLAVAVAVGAAVGFIRRRLERMAASPGESGEYDVAAQIEAGSRSHLAGVNGDRA